MRNSKLVLLLLAGYITGVSSQINHVGFEDFALPVDSFWDGSESAPQSSFTSQGLIFHNQYDTSWFYWSGGWAASNTTDSLTPGYSNLFSSRPGKGEASATYSLGQVGSFIQTESKSAFVLTQLSVTNSTYAYWSMALGDGFAKKFGGPSGMDPDYFRLIAIGYLNESTVYMDTFYLSDFRFADTASDYIVKNWVAFDLPNRMIDSLHFDLESTDTGSFGMNTPGFYAVDNIVYAQCHLQIDSFRISSGTIDVVYSGNYGELMYSWSEGSDQPILSPSAAGVYNLTITDSVGCFASGEVEFVPSSIHSSLEKMFVVRNQNQLQLAGDQTEGFTLEIYSLDGKLLGKSKGLQAVEVPQNVLVIGVVSDGYSEKKIIKITPYGKVFK